MSKIGLFFATDTGNTRKIAKRIKNDHFEPGVVEICNFEKATAEMIEGYDSLIFGTPTVGDGEYPAALEDFLPQFEDVDLRGKRIALYGLGDQVGYPQEFVDALGMFYEELASRGAEILGFWPNEGYDYELSRADMGDGRFCGLVLDLDNQSELTDARLAAWIADIKPVLLGADPS
ncbi:flavodoxin [Imhoffiella purpurea]|uniref:Flavodoxin n=1 Tax=Imhoffiella purpurea TaxID=1249627 RepID=W9VDJ2_9GAMM|nr:flavodoxin [Imhoffiella purpurea]EXJ14112.1 Flavodoxin 1 [Imhoffiella purpurea]